MNKSKPTLYLVLFRCDREAMVKVGALGDVSISPGYYVYAGSAKRNLTARLKRHRKLQKPFRWHIDYLRPHLVWVRSFQLTEHEGECALVRAFCLVTGATAVQKGLGSSDCRCEAHVLKLPQKEPAEWDPAGFSERWNAAGTAAFGSNHHD
ncbi:GIY-YIG nuclease family protein [Salisediminibacterium selenitireducens]|uniref:GIY-YIG domain-containing protein n=1 Tax=Bacillus selenitireducens (strain ATCC 700615 / DSM 15326 / MLS10) TaxID=439292 RepID=D6XT70_BACIE|nr:GIY-YIG nuclease family protein [Salisediminibacterium selenitireducens]ADH99006.1 protein of unknown function DUF123 [[Bacillus] selenitireducens MLS10]